VEKKSDHKINGAMRLKQKLMNIGQRRRGGQGAYASPSAKPRTGVPAHRVDWRTTSDQDLVLDGIRLGLLRTGLGRKPWGPGGQFKTRKALYVAVTRAKKADVQPTKESTAMAQAVAERWGR
jgi:hypothetical protein